MRSWWVPIWLADLFDDLRDMRLAPSSAALDLLQAEGTER
jgi:hypothetical protein